MTAAIAPETGVAFHDLGEILTRLAPRLLRLATRYTRDPEVSADVVQNAVEKVVRHEAQFRGDAQLSTWIHRIVVNEALMWLRSDRRRKRRSEPLDAIAAPAIPDPSPSPLDRLLAAERDRRVRHALREIGDEERELLERCVMHGEDYAGFGARKGLNPGAVKSRAYRARRRIEALLDEPSGGVALRAPSRARCAGRSRTSRTSTRARPAPAPRDRRPARPGRPR
jgi:RNA polymerase sigma-70 factor (ECF subfamily)